MANIQRSPADIAMARVKCPKCPQKAAMKCKAAKAMKVGRPRKCSKVKKAMKVAECSKGKKAMKAMKEWKVALKAAKVAMKAEAMKAMKEWKVAMKEAKVAMKECSKLKQAMKDVGCLKECSKATKAKIDEMKPTKRWKPGTLTAIPLDLEKLAKAANEGQ